MSLAAKYIYSKKIELEKEKAKRENRFSLFHATFSDQLFNSISSFKDFRDMFDMIKYNDKFCNISYEDGMTIDLIANRSKTFIHRTNLSLNSNGNEIPYNEDLNSIMSNGLKNYGHMNAAGGGAFVKYFPPLSLTMSHLKGITGYVNLLSPYKNNDTVIFASFPSDLVDEEGRPTKDYTDIYNVEGSVPSIKPEYMMGALIKTNTGYWKFYPRQEILDNQKKKNL